MMLLAEASTRPLYTLRIENDTASYGGRSPICVKLGFLGVVCESKEARKLNTKGTKRTKKQAKIID
jgi:hypothetical protein